MNELGFERERASSVGRSVNNDAALGTSARDGRVRFVDDGGTLWSVREVPASDLAGVHRPASLLFECAASFRRVLRYPDDWARLPRTALVALSEAR